jgi:hypothetical protein
VSFLLIACALLNLFLAIACASILHLYPRSIVLIIATIFNAAGFGFHVRSLCQQLDEHPKVEAKKS